MQVDEKGLDEIVKAAWRNVRGPLVGASDRQTYVIPTLTNDIMRDICRAAITAYLSARSAEPVAEKLQAMASAYDVGDGIRVERRNADAWAVCWQNDVLNTEGKWEWEPMPSNRGEDFIARTRHPFAEAWRLAEAAIRKGSGE